MVWSHGLSCPSLTPSAAHSDHAKMARNSVANLWVVSTSDDVSTIGSLQLDQCSSVSTISTINPSAFHLHSQSFSNNIQVPSRTFSTILPHHNRQLKLGSMALISMNIGKPPRTTMTTRRSTATFPRTIRSSAFTQKLDIEGCDPLALPLAALPYQQANNHWLRKLAASTRERYVPDPDIAAVVFMTELLTQWRHRGVDRDRAAMVRARQDGKTMDKTSRQIHCSGKDGSPFGPLIRTRSMR